MVFEIYQLYAIKLNGIAPLPHAKWRDEGQASGGNVIVVPTARGAARAPQRARIKPWDGKGLVASAQLRYRAPRKQEVVSMEEQEPAATSVPKEGEFRIELPEFEGPLDLLLHLIKKHELNILDLPIAFVTERYLQYLNMLRELDLEVAGEYLLMAATLAHIKSKMLLPRTDVEQQDDAEHAEETDPRLELIRRLLEYQKYKAASEVLGARAVAGRDVFARGADVAESAGPTPLAEVGLFKLLDAFQAILGRAKDRLAFEITAERITIHERMTQITELLRTRRSCQFTDLFEGDITRYEIVVTFLALLEMTKLRVARLYQPDYYTPIQVQYALLDADAPTIPPAASAEADAAPIGSSGDTTTDALELEDAAEDAHAATAEQEDQ